MEKFVLMSAGTALGLCFGYFYFAPKSTKKAKITNQVLFFPENANNLPQNRSLPKLVKYLNSAKKSIDLCLYMITCHDLGQAVLNRMESSDNVRVRLIADHSFAHVKGSLVSELRKRGAFVRIKESDFLMHHKFAIVDDDLVLSGSFNWTMQAASGNQENVIVSSEPEIVRPFCEHFTKMWTELE